MFGAKPLPEPMLTYGQFDPQEKTSVKFESKYKTFIRENAFENVVWKTASILSKKSEGCLFVFAYSIYTIRNIVIRQLKDEAETHGTIERLFTTIIQSQIWIIVRPFGDFIFAVLIHRIV